MLADKSQTQQNMSYRFMNSRIILNSVCRSSVCDYLTAWHCTAGNHDVFKPPFGIWVGQHRHMQSLRTHIQLSTPPSTPWNVSYFPQCCTARETQEHCPNGLWHNREIRAFLQQSASIRFHSTVPNNKWNNCCTLSVCQTFVLGTLEYRWYS